MSDAPQPRPGDETRPGKTSNDFVEQSHIVARLHRHLNYSIVGLSLLAIPVGIATGYGAWAFRLAFGSVGQWLRIDSQAPAGWLHLGELTLGGLLFGLVLQLLDWKRFRGPAHVIVAASENDGKLRARDGIVTVIADALALALAAPVGRYGPAVYLGASTGSLFAQAMRLNPTSIRILLGCGVAGGISAAFNAPIAGVIFAHEVILGHFRLRAFAPITLASVAAVAVTRFHEVEYVGMKLRSATHPVTPEDYPLYLLFGLVIAAVAMVYMRGIIDAGRVAERLHLPRWSQPMLGGALAGGVFLLVPEVMGLGDETFVGVLEQDLARPSYGLLALLVLAVAKLVASVACLGLRFPGGTFTPAMFIGAMLGGVFGMLVPALDYQISVLVGMGALVGAVVGAPLAVILIVFELTENYQAATAVMVAVVAANATVTRFFARSLFHRQIRDWGIEIHRSPEQRLLARRQVSEVVRRNVVTILASAGLDELRQLIGRHAGRTIYVVDGAESLVGTIDPDIDLPAHDTDSKSSESDAQKETSNAEPADRDAGATDEIDNAETAAHARPTPLNAGTLSRAPQLLLTREQSLWSAFVQLEASGLASAPVVESEMEPKLVGMVPMSTLLVAYRQAVRESDESEAH